MTSEPVVSVQGSLKATETASIETSKGESQSAREPSRPEAAGPGSAPNTDQVPLTVVPVLTKVEEEEDAEGDSEAETWIQSPEKKRNIVDSAPILQPSRGASATDESSTIVAAAPGNEDRPKKRKREDIENERPSPVSSQRSSLRSSPLSSPVLPTADSESDTSGRLSLRKARTERTRRNGVDSEHSSDSEHQDGQSTRRKRRPSEILPRTAHRANRGHNNVDTNSSERRETRSATYPRHSSAERSPSPPPTARREHRRGVSTQLTTTDIERKRRGRPPLINTRRNRSVDRGSVSSGSESLAPQRPQLHKYASTDHDTLSPAKTMGPRKYRDKNGRTWLARAANNSDFEQVRQKFAERPEDLDIADNAGNTPLQIAALEGFENIVKFLLEKGANPDTKNIDYDTPLIDAIENGHLHVVRLLLENGANPRMGNSKGDEPYELVPPDDENYATMRQLIFDAKEQGVRRRRSTDNSDAKKGDGSSITASAASPRDSPPATGPRSPPPFSSRRKTGRSDMTRNDLLWQATTQENLAKLAQKGDVQGVITILNILQKAETEAVIAAAKAGHDEVLSYLLAMGDPNPDPLPLESKRPGYNTPMLAAIGRGNPKVLQLLVDQAGFNPTRKHKDKTYYELAEDRKGEEWEKEYKILKLAFDSHGAGKGRKESLPRKTREPAKRQSSSPILTHKSLPRRSPDPSHDFKGRASTITNEQKKPRQDRRDELSTAVASDHDQSVNSIRKAHRTRRSQSDLPPLGTLEGDIGQRRRRLVSGKEHRRRKSVVSDDTSDDEGANEVKNEEKPTTAVKRARSSLTPETAQSMNQELSRVMVKKRRTILESSPEEARPLLRQQQSPHPPAAPHIQDVDMRDDDQKVLGDIDEVFKQHKRKRSDDNVQPLGPDPSLGEGRENAKRIREEAQPESPVIQPAAELPPISQNDQQPPVDSSIIVPVSEAAKQESERLARQEADRSKAERARFEEEERQAEERRATEAAEARRLIEEEAAARKKEEQEREEQLRKENEERRRRQQEELHRLQYIEAERKRREALPIVLNKCALMFDHGDSSAKSHGWLSKFLPLFTVRTKQLDPTYAAETQEEKWVPNFQIAGLLATKDLNLRSYTSFEKRQVTDMQRQCLWRVARNMLSYEYDVKTYNTSIKQAIEKEEEEYPKFLAMEELFWVKLSDFEDQIQRYDHLRGLDIKQQAISLRPYKAIRRQSSSQVNGTMQPKKLSNGVPLSPYVPSLGQNES